MLSSSALSVGRVPDCAFRGDWQCVSVWRLHQAASPVLRISGRNCGKGSLCSKNGGNDFGRMGLSLSSNGIPRGLKHHNRREFVCQTASREIEPQPWPEDELSSKVEETKRYRAWDALTQKLTEFSVFFFVLLLMPQLIKNAGYLKTKQFAMIGALPWMGYTTGLMGNMLLLTYFTGKREGGAMTVQAVGVVATYLLITQIFAAGYMPMAPWAGLSTLVLLSLVLNYLSYSGTISDGARSIWMDFQGGVGWAVLAQVLWSSFSSEPTTAPGVISTLLVAAIIILRRMGKLSGGVTRAWEASSAWIATLLFMFMPVPQLILNLTQPSSLAGLSVSTNFLAMAGNCFMIPRALFLRDTIWLTGSTWGALVMGWGIIFSLYRANMLSGSLFFTVSAALAAFLGGVLFQDAKAR